MSSGLPEQSKRSSTRDPDSVQDAQNVRVTEKSPLKVSTNKETEMMQKAAPQRKERQKVAHSNKFDQSCSSKEPSPKNSRYAENICSPSSTSQVSIWLLIKCFTNC